MAKLTGDQVIQALSDTIRNISNFGIAARVRALNRLNEEWNETIKQEDPNLLIQRTTITIVEGTNSYALPSDFLDINDPFTGVFAPDPQGNFKDQLQVTQPGSTMTGYYIVNQTLFLTPVPKTGFNTETVVVLYMPVLQRLTGTGEDLVIDERFEELAHDGILKEYYKFMQMGAEYLEAQEDYINSLNNFIIRIGKQSIAGGLPDISHAYGNA